jgi:hypothetical protein
MQKKIVIKLCMLVGYIIDYVQIYFYILKKTLKYIYIFLNQWIMELRSQKHFPRIIMCASSLISNQSIMLALTKAIIRPQSQTNIKELFQKITAYYHYSISISKLLQ